ncbi:hypothetical protein [Clostridium felsineum]|uniref:Uncharacterized protein n=1 Tax=Clostridium felsineum TaxID=36839 RepID=A0A1S8M2I7_9CLOT|nr:hypothetical protein [Clostridium felsineum]URZ06779.1 hypothetical protein CLROS_021120 [Clostridium felsineum]URZ11811.1 hypothetical protein CROST_025280 [Clostridium felsineum]
MNRIQQLYKDLFGIEPEVKDKNDLEELEEKLEKDLAEVKSIEKNSK